MWEHGSDWGVMGDWGGTWWRPSGMIIWLLLLVGILVAIVWLVRSISGGRGPDPFPPRRPAGLDILEERYARGEIDRDEYLQKKRDLSE